jgi:hypothetical protein
MWFRMADGSEKTVFPFEYLTEPPDRDIFLISIESREREIDDQLWDKVVAGYARYTRGEKRMMQKNFSVTYRNPGHWDIYGDGGRLFCIRGDSGDYYIRDERPEVGKTSAGPFPTVESAMAWICATLMTEEEKDGHHDKH